jgi:hypothetical protein
MSVLPIDLTQTHLAKAITHSKSIIHIASFQENISPMGFDIMCSTFALMVEQFLGPNSDQQLQAGVMAEKWAVAWDWVGF